MASPFQPQGEKIPTRNKRKSSFFEAVYDPSDGAAFPVSGWDFSQEKLRHHVTLTASGFLSEFDQGDKFVVTSVSFDKCDFFGDFSTVTPSFKKCVFERCDFGLTSWRRAKFKNCKFHRCSLSLAVFEYCEFRDCDFSEISFSGNETILTGTIVTNPEAFVAAGYTNLDEDIVKSKASGKNVDYQRMRLEGTKATVARAIMGSLAVSGDESSYYESVKTYQKVSVEAKIMMARHVLSTKKGADITISALFNLCVLILEKIILNIAGKVNNWGGSVARPALIGLGIIFLFTFIYYMTGLRQSLFKAFVTSMDITLLIGYTKHALAGDVSRIQLLYGFNMVLGLMWYSIFVPTLINRISRVR